MTKSRNRMRSWSLAVLVLISLPFVLCVAPMLWGYSAYIVLTGSMEQQIPAGAVAVVRPPVPEDMVLGNIVMFEYRQANVLHRIVGFDESGAAAAYTQGDANDQGQAILVPFDEMKGVYAYHLAYIGYTVLWIQRQWLFWTAVIGAVGIWLYRRGKKSGAEPQQEEAV